MLEAMPRVPLAEWCHELRVMLCRGRVPSPGELIASRDDRNLPGQAVLLFIPLQRRLATAYLLDKRRDTEIRDNCEVPTVEGGQHSGRPEVERGQERVGFLARKSNK